MLRCCSRLLGPLTSSPIALPRRSTLNSSGTRTDKRRESGGTCRRLNWLDPASPLAHLLSTHESAFQQHLQVRNCLQATAQRCGQANLCHPAQLCKRMLCACMQLQGLPDALSIALNSFQTHFALMGVLRADAAHCCPFLAGGSSNESGSDDRGDAAASDEACSSSADLAEGSDAGATDGEAPSSDAAVSEDNEAPAPTAKRRRSNASTPMATAVSSGAMRADQFASFKRRKNHQQVLCSSDEEGSDDDELQVRLHDIISSEAVLMWLTE